MKTKTLHRKIVYDGQRVSSIWQVPTGYRPDRDAALVLAHGAGAGMRHPFMRAMARLLVQRGLMVVRFNFPYMEAGRRAPDRAPALLACWRAVIARLRADTLSPRTLFIGGKSMGGRMATLLAAEGEELGGVVLLGFPLHPPRQPGGQRAAHFPDIRCPMLFLQGDRDPLCELAQLKSRLGSRRFRLKVVGGADHGFHVPKRSGISDAEVLAGMADTILAWMADPG